MYNKIDHNIRNNAKLSMLDYCLLDCIYQLSTSGKERYKGWCDMKKSKFTFLASERTIVNAFNRLIDNNWMEFKNPDRRFLKRTTKKYYTEVRMYIEGVKVLHRATSSPVQELHPKGERVAPQTVQELHPKGERVAPNNNKDTYKDINKNINKVEWGTSSSKNKVEDKEEKNEVSKSQKSCAKKGPHNFADNTPARSYDSLSKFDTRENKQLPFDVVSASQTLKLIFPKKEDALKAYNEIYSEKATIEVVEKSWRTFIEKRFSNGYAQVRNVLVLRKVFFEWTKNQVKYDRNGQRVRPSQNNISLENDLIDFNEDRDRRLREESRNSN
jgi:hypothetical protein